jgi:hypothetical protein
MLYTLEQFATDIRNALRADPGPAAKKEIRDRSTYTRLVAARLPGGRPHRGRWHVLAHETADLLEDIALPR